MTEDKKSKWYRPQWLKDRILPTRQDSVVKPSWSREGSLYISAAGIVFMVWSILLTIGFTIGEMTGEETGWAWTLPIIAFVTGIILLFTSVAISFGESWFKTPSERNTVSFILTKVRGGEQLTFDEFDVLCKSVEEQVRVLLESTVYIHKKDEKQLKHLELQSQVAWLQELTFRTLFNLLETVQMPDEFAWDIERSQAFDYIPKTSS